jgi:hypothetical protein
MLNYPNNKEYLITEFFMCDCASPGHVVSFIWFNDEDEECYVEFPVELQPWKRRLKYCARLLFLGKDYDMLGDWICRQGEENRFLEYLKFMRDTVRGELKPSDTVVFRTNNGEYRLELKYDEEFDFMFLDIIYGAENSLWKKLVWVYRCLIGSPYVFQHRCFTIHRSDFDNMVNLILRNKTEERRLKYVREGEIYQPLLIKEK